MAKKLPFPKYLNRSRLFITFELDQVIFFAIVAAGVIFFSFMASLPIIAVVLLLLVSTYISGKIYQRLVKEQSPGFIQHFFYERGMSNPHGSKRGKRGFFPYGFERHFKD